MLKTDLCPLSMHHAGGPIKSVGRLILRRSTSKGRRQPPVVQSQDWSQSIQIETDKITCKRTKRESIERDDAGGRLESALECIKICD
ncbi:hypothetical protein EVAR_36305_1 [Eumeta japonica]|uniref:Uncharacterized protein n=1 Tax=Eumeta variegata TaxID=151549 RepID=A0A4C1VI65_EUMVA|nr:hypothetical protein EVAR_36305_1 [Eumeta japonica]